MAPKQSTDPLQSLFPVLRYRDAPAAIAWLKSTFGCEEQMVAPGDDGTIAHAQLALQGGVFMLSSLCDKDPLNLTTPAAHGYSTQAIYVATGEVDALYAKAQAAGAEIVVPLQDMEYGSREFTARDPEGHCWSFGTYRP